MGVASSGMRSGVRVAHTLVSLQFVIRCGLHGVSGVLLLLLGTLLGIECSTLVSDFGA